MRLVFFDLETGGLNPLKNPIIQIAAVAVDAALNELFHFERKLTFDVTTAEKDALEMNSYDKDVWDQVAVSPSAAANDFSATLKKFADVEMVSKAGNPYRVAQLVGHNSAFDFSFIQELFRVKSMFLPASYRVMDTLQRALWHFHELPASARRPENYKLGTLADFFGIKAEKAHDALSDVRTTIAVYRHIQRIESHAD